MTGQSNRYILHMIIIYLFFVFFASFCIHIADSFFSNLNIVTRSLWIQCDIINDNSCVRCFRSVFWVHPAVGSGHRLRRFPHRRPAHRRSLVHQNPHRWAEHIRPAHCSTPYALLLIIRERRWDECVSGNISAPLAYEGRDLKGGEGDLNKPRDDLPLEIRWNS